MIRLKVGMNKEFDDSANDLLYARIAHRLQDIGRNLADVRAKQGRSANQPVGADL